MNLVFTPTAWEQYNKWVVEDVKIAIRITELIKSIEREGLSKGIGKPEPLKHRKLWSRRINQEHRLLYNMDSNRNLIIYACYGHYKD
jgi:toxin YoeB